MTMPTEKPTPMHEPKTEVVESEPHRPMCSASHCEPDCPHYLSSLTDGELERLASEMHQVGCWVGRYLLDNEGPPDEDLILRGFRLFGKKSK